MEIHISSLTNIRKCWPGCGFLERTEANASSRELEWRNSECKEHSCSICQWLLGAVLFIFGIISSFPTSLIWILYWLLCILSSRYIKYARGTAFRRGVGERKENNYCYTLEHINEYINNWSTVMFPPNSHQNLYKPALQYITSHYNVCSKNQCISKLFVSKLIYFHNNMDCQTLTSC